MLFFEVHCVRTLTLNVKVKLVANDKGDNDKAPDFRLQAANHDIGAAWKKTSEVGREYLSVTLDDPSFPAKGEGLETIGITEMD
ncbi:DUF736 family protein [Alcaligenaceae bacterium]|nr:DUF736 family protein [Alcaligenaceae bacterium]